VFQFRFSPDSESPPHTHRCHAIAYTISGEWEYEGVKLTAGSVAYEPIDSRHTPSSATGAELVVFLASDSGVFLVNELPDGTEAILDMDVFKRLDAIRTGNDLSNASVAFSR